MPKFKKAEAKIDDIYLQLCCEFIRSKEDLVLCKNVFRPLQIEIRNRWREGIKHLLTARNYILEGIYQNYTIGMMFKKNMISTRSDFSKFIGILSSYNFDNISNEELWDIMKVDTKLDTSFISNNDSIDKNLIENIDLESSIYQFEFFELRIES